MSTKKFPITYSPTKRLYLASLKYGNASLTLVEVERETEKMYMVIPGATRILVGSTIISTFKQRVKKERVHAFETMIGALDWLWGAAVKSEASYKKMYDEAAELVTQVETCLDTERKQPGIVMQLLDQVERTTSWQRVPFSVLEAKEAQE